MREFGKFWFIGLLGFIGDDDWKILVYEFIGLCRFGKGS
jgi:hypothetical protein